MRDITMSNERPNPDDLLQQVQEEEHKEKSGKLKIYLGAAPGVGKTYTMLTDALQKQSSGLDVIVGVVETHNRQEVDNLLNNFVVLPRQIIHYHEKQLLEFDLDAALKRNPGLILIDEMAHTNAIGVRHKKRWQDIQELLDRGIDVYTTLNVQHIESLNDDVVRVIQAPIKETVPDRMIEIANTIALVDIPPEDLLKRLSEGKVYVPAQAELAAESFFRKGNLIALRELALRTLAKRVNEQALLYRQGQRIKQIWPIVEKILICVGPGPESLKLIRAGKRMAMSLQAEWIAVYVDITGISSSEDSRNKAIQNLRFAEQLGAETRVISGYDIVHEIMNYASQQNITLIMIWKNIRTRWKDLFFRSLANEILRHSGEIDVYTMTGERRKKPRTSPAPKRKTSWRIYLISMSIVSLTTMIGLLFAPILNDKNLFMIYLLGMIAIALFGRIGPAILGNICSLLVYKFLFFPPYYTLSVANHDDLFTLVMMLAVAQIISQLTVLTRRQIKIARITEQHTASLYTLSRKLSQTRGTIKLLEVGINYIAQIFDSEVLALMPRRNRLVISAKSRTTQELDAKERGIAQWVYEMGQKAGLGTDTLSFSNALYIPLGGSRGDKIGVLRIHPNHSERLVSPEKIHLLESCAYQISLALEVDRLQEKEKKSQLIAESNRIRAALLEAISENLQSPLVSIMTSANMQIEMAIQLQNFELEQSGKNIYSAAEELRHLMDNLLDEHQKQNKASNK